VTTLPGLMDLLVVKREVLGQGSKERTGQASKEPGKRAKQALEYWSWDGRVSAHQMRGWIPSTRESFWIKLSKSS